MRSKLGWPIANRPIGRLRDLMENRKKPAVRGHGGLSVDIAQKLGGKEHAKHNLSASAAQAASLGRQFEQQARTHHAAGLTLPGSLGEQELGLSAFYTALSRALMKEARNGR